MNRKWVRSGLLFAGFVLVAWGVATYLPWDSWAERESSIREMIAGHPVKAWMLGFLVYFLASLVPGTRGKAMLFGWLFGFWPSLLLVNVSLTLAALVGFFLSRFLLRDAVTGRYGWQLERVNQVLETEGAFYVILLRVVPVSFTFTNYLLGATKLHHRTYWWATQLGLLPGNIVFVNAGSQLPSLAEWTEHGWLAIASWETVTGLVVLSLFSLGTPYLVRRYLTPHYSCDAAKPR